MEEESINVSERLRFHPHGSVNEEHLPTVNINKPVIQAEIRPGMFSIIDGNNRMEKPIGIK